MTLQGEGKDEKKDWGERNGGDGERDLKRKRNGRGGEGGND